MTTAHGDINIRASHMKLHTEPCPCVQRSSAEAGRGETQPSDMQTGLQSWILARLLTITDSEPKRLLNCPIRDWVVLDPFYNYENNRLFPCFFSKVTALFSCLLLARG